MEHMLQQQNYQLKNEITDLKNAFDLNRDILKIVSTCNQRSDPQLHLLLQIINRLTTVNNQAMLHSIELIQQKHALKQQNLKLNLEVMRIQAKVKREIEMNKINNIPNESKFAMQEQFNALNKEIMAANEERIIKEHQIEYWKEKYTNFIKQQQLTNQNLIKQQQLTNQQLSMGQIKQKIKRKYTSNPFFQQSLDNKQLKKENKTLKLYIQQLQNRLLVFIKAYSLSQESINNGYSPKRNSPSQYFEEQRQEIRLLKYALNDIHVERKEDQYILTVTKRFKEKDTINTQYFKEKRSSSWPKHENVKVEPEKQIKEKERYIARMQQRQY